MADIKDTTPHAECALSEKALPHYIANHIARTSDEHWLWLGPMSKWGIPILEIDGREETATRLIYETVFAPLPVTTWLGADCNEPLCVSPLHHSIRIGGYARTDRETMAQDYSKCIEQAILWATDRRRSQQERVTAFELAKALRQGLEACQGGNS